MLSLQYQYTLLFYKMARQAIELADSVRKSDMQVTTKDVLVSSGTGEAVALGCVGVNPQAFWRRNRRRVFYR